MAVAYLLFRFTPEAETAEKKNNQSEPHEAEDDDEEPHVRLPDAAMSAHRRIRLCRTRLRRFSVGRQADVDSLQRSAGLHVERRS